jgi:hypothetical protein
MSILPLFSEAQRTKKDFGVGWMRQLLQASYLRFSRCSLDPWEYYFFQVYLDRYPWPEKRRFAGWRREIALDRALNAGGARHLANDKLAFHAHMIAHDAPLPGLFATYCDVEHEIPGVVNLHTADDAGRYLQNAAHTPVFIKPVRGAHGRNIFSVDALAADGQSLVLSSGETPDLGEFVAGLDTQERSGWLFQERLPGDEAITRFCGDRLTSIRFIVIFTPRGPEILSAVWKIPTGRNITDNFAVGHSGNMIAGIELESGRVLHMVQGAGWKNVSTTKHPDTGTELEDAGFADRRLPGWDAAREVCLKYAELFPDLRLQHWDIALTDHGPVILEVNVEGGMRTHQIVQQRGIVDERLEKAGAKFGV